MLRRNLLYTAITRSKKFLILCGEESALEWGVKNNEDSLRQTSLTMRLTETEKIMDAELAALQKNFLSVYTMPILAWRESLRLILCKSKWLPSWKPFLRMSHRGNAHDKTVPKRWLITF